MNEEKAALITGKALERYFDFNEASFEFHKLFNLDHREARTIAILGGTFLEMALEHILRAYFPEDEKEVDNLFDYNQPLGTFSGKISMAFCLGLIDKLIKDDLTLVRKIRNEFAHELFANFDNAKISSWCNELKFHKVFLMTEPPKDATAIEIFQVGVNTLISNLSGCISNARGQKLKIEDGLKVFIQR